MQGGDQINEARLAPEMASRRLLVLAFVRHYITRWGSSPSYGEIAHAVGTTRKRVQVAVRALAAQGELLRVPGPRGLALPEAEKAAVEQLRALGWTINLRAKIGTKQTLPRLPVLDYCPEHDHETDPALRQISAAAAAAEDPRRLGGAAS